MWTTEKITADAAEKMQTTNGLLLNKAYDVEHPKEPTDQDIVCDTTGDFGFKIEPEYEDLFEDVNNAPKNTMEGLRLKGWTAELTVGCLSVTKETLDTAMGATTAIGENGLRPMRPGMVPAKCFSDKSWIGNMIDPNKVMVIIYRNAMSPTGLNYTSSEGKGKINLTLRAFSSAKKQDEVPVECYILTKEEGSPAAAAKETEVKP